MSSKYGNLRDYINKWMYPLPSFLRVFSWSWNMGMLQLTDKQSPNDRDVLVSTRYQIDLQSLLGRWRLFTAAV